MPLRDITFKLGLLWYVKLQWLCLFQHTQRTKFLFVRCSFIVAIKFLILHCPPLVHYKKHRVSAGDYYNKSHYFIQIDVKTLKIKFGITRLSSASWFWWLWCRNRVRMCVECNVILPLRRTHKRIRKVFDQNKQLS